MNNSIYLMLIVPYSTVLIVGFLIYRGMKKNQEYQRAHEARETAGQPAQG